MAAKPKVVIIGGATPFQPSPPSRSSHLQRPSETQFFHWASSSVPFASCRWSRWGELCKGRRPCCDRRCDPDRHQRIPRGKSLAIMQCPMRLVMVWQYTTEAVMNHRPRRRHSVRSRSQRGSKSAYGGTLITSREKRSSFLGVSRALMTHLSSWRTGRRSHSTTSSSYAATEAPHVHPAAIYVVNLFVVPSQLRWFRPNSGSVPIALKPGFHPWLCAGCRLKCEIHG